MNSIIKERASRKFHVRGHIFPSRQRARANFFFFQERKGDEQAWLDVSTFINGDTFAILMRELELVLYIYTRFKMLREHVDTRLIYTGWFIFERVDGKRCK